MEKHYSYKKKRVNKVHLNMYLNHMNSDSKNELKEVLQFSFQDFWLLFLSPKNKNKHSEQVF